MPGIFSKVQIALKNKTTYRSGLLQTKAYRILKQFTSVALESREISTIDWAFLGLLHEEPEGMYFHEVALELGVERPFVTALANALIRKGFVSKEKCKDDSRAKVLCLTPKGTVFVTETERYLRDEVKTLVKDISYGDLATYLSVLEKIIENAHLSH